MLICRFTILLWVTTRTGLHAPMLRKHISCLILQCCICLKHTVLAPVSVKTPLLNTQCPWIQLSHA